MSQVWRIENPHIRPNGGVVVIEQYDVLQILAGGKWLDYCGIKTESEAKKSVFMALNNAEFRIVNFQGKAIIENGGVNHVV